MFEVIDDRLKIQTNPDKLLKQFKKMVTCYIFDYFTYLNLNQENNRLKFK